MAQLAIRGHATRGDEVISILKMLGGKREDRELYGNVSHYGYYIHDKGYISLMHCSLLKNAIFFTLEEFLEKFPYKVGDKVLYKYDKKTYFIRKIFWKNDKILYELSDEVYPEGCSMPDTIIFDVDVIKLQSYKEEIMEERKYADLRIDIDQDDKLATEVTIDGDKITPPENYLIGKITKVDNGMLVEFVKKQPQYPKTYEECCEVLGIDVSRTIGHSGDCPFYMDVTCYENNLLSCLADLRKLLICRDAYWKIAGDWKPDWLNAEQDKHVIFTHNNAICSNRYVLGHYILAFPTKEMRDAFYENFKELINECKSLL